MRFEEIIGHERPVTILRRALANNTLAHAYLFSGDEGVGKKMTALALAAAVNCAAAVPAGGCGECSSCRRTAAGRHPDVHLVMPESENEALLASLSAKQAEKASSEIKIDQIRDAQERMSLTPSEGRKKFLIVDGADTLNPAAQNAFLKTLEEPPGDSVIILVASRPRSLLPTIRSRCQEVRFLPLSRQQLADVVAERLGVPGPDAWFAAALALGSMGRALTMNIEQEKAAREELRELWSALPGMSESDLLSRAEGFGRDRDRFERMLDLGVELIRDALVLSETGDEQLLVDVRGAGLHRQFAERFPRQRLLRDLDLITGSRSLLEKRVAAQLVAEHLLLELAN